MLCCVWCCFRPENTCCVVAIVLLLDWDWGAKCCKVHRTKRETQVGFRPDVMWCVPKKTALCGSLIHGIEIVCVYYSMWFNWKHSAYGTVIGWIRGLPHIVYGHLMCNATWYQYWLCSNTRRCDVYAAEIPYIYIYIVYCLRGKGQVESEKQDGWGKTCVEFAFGL